MLLVLLQNQRAELTLTGDLKKFISSQELKDSDSDSDSSEVFKHILFVVKLFPSLKKIFTPFVLNDWPVVTNEQSR